MKKLIYILAFLLISIGSFAQSLKDSLNAQYKPFLDLAVKAVEEATGKTSIYGIPYSFIEKILLLIVVGIIVGMHKKDLSDVNTENKKVLADTQAAHKEALQTALDAHAKTIKTILQR